MNKEPLVSIITVVYNGEQYIEQTIKNVINQSYKNIEYIIIDGDSNDRTIDIIQKYQNHISYWSSEKDNGVYDAMNKGISYANGEIIGIINADDYYNEFSVQEAVDKLTNKESVEVFFGNLRRIYSPNSCKVICVPIPTNLCNNKINIVHPTVFVKRRVYTRKIFDSNLKIAADLDFLLTVCNKSNTVKSNRVITNMRIGGLSSNFVINNKEMFIVYRRFLPILLSFFMMLRILSIKISVLLLKKIGQYTKNIFKI